MAKGKRQVELVAILGTNGTGKSTLARKIVEHSKRRTIIVDFEGAEKMWRDVKRIDVRDQQEMATFTGMRKAIWLQHKEKTLYYLRNNFQNGIIVFDDCRLYLKPRLAEEHERLMVRRRQNEQDQFYIAHGFTEVPPRTFTFMSKILLFRTKDSVRRLRDNFQDYNLVETKQKAVNAASETDVHYMEEVQF